MAGNSGGEGRKEGVCGVTRLLSTSSEIISSPVLRRRNGEIMREALREGGRESKGGDNSHDEVPGRKEGCDI